VPARLLRPARILAAVVLVALAAGCGGSGQSAEDLVAETVEATGAVESFHLVIDVENVETSDSGLSLTFVDGDVVVPDRLKGRVGGTFLGLSISTDLIVIGDDYYLKMPFGGWREIDVDTLPATFFDPEQGILAVIQGASDLLLAGREEVGGVECELVTGKVLTDVVKTLLNTAYGTRTLELELAIGKDDKLLRRVRLIGPISPSEDGDAVRTVDLSQFDEPVQIEAPET
jgi:lipoprotein LprG